jgi:T-complex protein 1 subunit eta
VLLAGELLKEIKGFIEEGVSPHIAIKGYRTACQLVKKKRTASQGIDVSIQSAEGYEF